MSDRRKPSGARNFGISLIMVLFIVLCFAVFAMLSLSTAKDNLETSQQYAERKAAYYEELNTAEEQAYKAATEAR